LFPVETEVFRGVFDYRNGVDHIREFRWSTRKKMFLVNAMDKEMYWFRKIILSQKTK